MKMHLLRGTVMALTLLAPGLSSAQPAQPPVEEPAPALSRIELEEPVQTNKVNRIGLSYRMGLNINVDFKKLGGFPAISDPGPALGITNRSYDNGSYNRVDISGNAGGLTWNWGYEQPGQLQGGALVMESASSPNNVTSKNQDDDPQHGFELSYQRELGRGENGKWRWGAEAALGYTSIEVSDSRDLRGNINRIIDSYTIPEGVVIPNAPYHGTFEGPGALISALPDRTTQVISREARITGRRELESDVYMLRLGPYFEFPIYKKLYGILSGGLTLAIGDTDFSYNETVEIEGSGSISRSSSGSQTDFLVGGYAAATLAYAFTDEWSGFVGYQFQAAGESVTSSRVKNGAPESKKQSVLDMGEAMMVVFGVSYAF
jgi:hypothetical protein